MKNIVLTQQEKQKIIDYFKLYKSESKNFDILNKFSAIFFLIIQDSIQILYDFFQDQKIKNNKLQMRVANMLAKDFIDYIIQNSLNENKTIQFLEQNIGEFIEAYEYFIINIK